MIFEFYAHKPGMYKWFAASLIVLIFLNALFIRLMHSLLLNWNTLINKSVILIVPWILFLFLPSVFLGMLIYYSLVKRYMITCTEDELWIERINSRKQSMQSRKFLWSDVKEFKFSDFEDNEYFSLIFHEKKNNLILHRNTGDFDLFFEELKKHLT